MRSLAVITLLCLPVCVLAQAGTMLHLCETLEGVRVGMGNQAEASKLFLSYAAEHVTEGVAAIGGVSFAPDTPGNFYLSIYLPIEPTDFSDRALAFDAASSTPELSRALYVRGYNEAGNIVMSWNSWDGRLTTEAQTFTLTPGEDSAGLRWEPGRVASDDRSAVTRLEFITGTGAKDVYFNMTVDNVQVLPAL